MEEDAGKSLHEGFADSDRKTYVDYNRSGVPLIEIVTEPDLRSAADAAEFFTRLRALLVWLGVNDGNMEEGSLRCDANVSVRRRGTEALGTKAEVKNLNSFRFLQKALEYEIERQVERRERGRTRSCRRRACGMPPPAGPCRCAARKKRTTTGIFPSPICRRSSSMPGAWSGSRPRCRSCLTRGGAGSSSSMRCPSTTPCQLTQSRALADYFEATVAAGATAKAASNWIMGELARKLKEQDLDVASSPLTPDRLAGLLALIEKGTISGSMAKDVFDRMFSSNQAADDIVAAEGLAQIDDESQIVGPDCRTCSPGTPTRSSSTGAARPAPSAFSSVR